MVKNKILLEPTADTASLEKLITRFEIPPSDIVIFGDGSGSSWPLPIGWGSILIDVNSGLRKSFQGGASTGTAITAELRAYFDPLDWHNSWRSRKDLSGLVRVCIVTDNATLAADGNAIATTQKSIQKTKRLAPHWAFLFAFERFGYVFKFVHKNRATSVLNCYADTLSKICFATMKEVPPVVDAQGEPVSIYFANASESTVARP